MAEDRVIEDYHNAVNAEILSYIDTVKATGPKSVPPLKVGQISMNQAEILKTLTGVDYTGYSVMLTGDAVAHIERRHGVFGAADNSMSDPNDLARNGYYFVSEAAPNSKGKKIYIISAYILR